MLYYTSNELFSKIVEPDKKEPMKKRIGFLILMYSVIYFAVGCKNSEPKVPEALVVSVIGDVTMGDKKVKNGDILRNQDSLRTGAKSICDLQVTGMDSDVTIRVKENSEFALGATVKNEVKNVQMKIMTGKVLVNSERLNSKNNLETITPTVVMGVRGTKYEVEIGKDSNGSVAVLDGKVASRVVIPEIENLPPEVRAKSATLRKLDSFLKEKELVLQTGNSTTVSKKQSETILKETGLGDVLKNADPSKLADDIDTKLSPEKLSEKTAKISDKDLKPEVVQVSPEELEKRLKEYDEFKPVSKTSPAEPFVPEKEKEVEKPKSEPIQKKMEPKPQTNNIAPVTPVTPPEKKVEEVKVEPKKVEEPKVEEPKAVEKPEHEMTAAEKKAEEEKAKVNLDSKSWGPEEKKMLWSEAKQKCDSKNMRLPTKKELLQIYQSQGVFKDWQYINYWTSEEFVTESVFSGKKSKVWTIDMSNGEGTEVDKAENQQLISRCRKK